MVKKFRIGQIDVGGCSPFILMAGPCVIEDKRSVMAIASKLKEITSRLRIPLVFKASYDKANRTSITAFRGPGIHKGLAILEEVKKKFQVPILSDVHSVSEVNLVAEILDVIQIPAFLCRQTDLIVAAAQTGKILNVKKGQFMAPWDMKYVVEKSRRSGNSRIILTDRGASFGYNNLVSDFRSLKIMRALGCPVIFDATHSVQQPGGLGAVSGGKSEFIPLLARCAVAAGCDGVFMEVHSNPRRALSDAANMLSLGRLEALLADLKAIDQVVKKRKRLCP